MVLVLMVLVFVLVMMMMILVAIIVSVMMVFVLVTIIVVIFAACLCLVHQCADTVDVGASQRHGDARQGTPDQGSTGNGDAPTSCVTREKVSLEQRRRRRSRQCRSGADRPKHVTRLRAVGHDHLKPSAREGCPDFEDPDPVWIRGPVERQCCVRERHPRGKTVDTRRDTSKRERPKHRRHVAREGSSGDGLGTRHETDRAVRAEEASASVRGSQVVHVNCPRNRATGICDGAAGGDAYVSGNHAGSTGYSRATQNGEACRRAQ